MTRTPISGTGHQSLITNHWVCAPSTDLSHRPSALRTVVGALRTSLSPVTFVTPSRSSRLVTPSRSSRPSRLVTPSQLSRAWYII